MRTSFFVAIALAAACAPAADQAASAPAAPDTAAVRVGLQAASDKWDVLAVAGDAAGIATLFTEDGTVAFFGAPTTTGRANIQAMMTGLYSVAKVTAAKGTILGVTAPAPGLATARGTYTEVVDSSGVTISNWWRWAASYRQAPDGQWLMTYLMSFPDSVSRAK
jgi:uncharacterized protein (TIGR02246 family)